MWRILAGWTLGKALPLQRQRRQAEIGARDLAIGIGQDHQAGLAANHGTLSAHRGVHGVGEPEG